LLSADALSWVDHLLRQGYRIGIEQADERRFRANSWSDCASVKTSETNEVVTAIERCLIENPGKYVRLFSIDLKTRLRSGERIVQSPRS
jgi:carbon dioxide concentrating mechanism protein CcmM